MPVEPSWAAPSNDITLFPTIRDAIDVFLPDDKTQYGINEDFIDDRKFHTLNDGEYEKDDMSQGHWRVSGYTSSMAMAPSIESGQPEVLNDMFMHFL